MTLPSLILCHPGHQNLLDNGVLHRDISQGNIIIVRDLSGNANCSKDDNGKDCGSSPEKHISTKGQLIDLDYAKAVKDKHPITDEARSVSVFRELVPPLLLNIKIYSVLGHLLVMRLYSKRL